MFFLNLPAPETAAPDAAGRGDRVGSAVRIAGARFTVIGTVRQTAGSNAPDLYIPMARA